MSATVRTVLAVSAGFLAVLVVIGGVLVLALGPDSGKDGATDGRQVPPGTTLPPVPDGQTVTTPPGRMRVVHHDVTFLVLDGWTWGALDQWCIGDGRPHVQLPGTAQTEVACLPNAIGYGARLSPVADDVPAPREGDVPRGAVVERVEVTSRLVLDVVARDREELDAVLGSVRELADDDRVDGCPTALEVPSLGDAATTGTEPGEPLSMCAYDVAGRPNLLGAAPLGDRADAALGAVRTAPDGRGPDAAPEECSDWEEDSAFALVSARGPVAWIHLTGCRGHGVDLGGGDTRRLTEEVLAFVDVPGWSGATISEVPWPDRPDDPDAPVSSEG